jgi:predicted nucleic acid-binding protein
VSDFDVLVDSDAFVGRFYPDDAHHPRSLALFAECEQARLTLVVTSYVIAETATVLSNRSGQALARKFLSIIEGSRMPIIHINEELQQAALAVFKQQDQRGTSVTDCANVIVMQQLAIPKIFSFDAFYSKRFGLSPIAERA